MLPVNQITPLFSQEASLKRFKPWWESVIDWLCCSLLFIAVVAWSIILEEGSGVRCIQKPPQNETFWNSVYAKYCSRRCALELFKGILVYYPYVVSAQGIMLIFCQIFWLKIPDVSSKMEAVDMIVQAIEKTNSEAAQDMGMIHSKLRLGFLLEEKTKIVSRLFIVKSALICVLSSIPLGLISGLWFTMELWNKRNAECHVQGCPAVHCNIGAGRHTFVIVCINLVILVLLLLFSIVSAFYLFCCKVRTVKDVKEEIEKTNEKKRKNEKTRRKNEERKLLTVSRCTVNKTDKAYQSDDLYFVLGLLDTNLHDGGFVTEKIKELIEKIKENEEQLADPAANQPAETSV